MDQTKFGRRTLAFLQVAAWRLAPRLRSRYLSLAACPLRAMSPKKLQKLADPKSSPETLALENINGKYFDDLATIMSVIMGHKSFGRTLKALPKDKGGIIEPLFGGNFQKWRGRCRRESGINQ